MHWAMACCSSRRGQILMALRLTVIAVAVFILTFGLGRLRRVQSYGVKNHGSFIMLHNEIHSNHTSTTSLKLPYPTATRPLREILEAHWILELWAFLTGLESKHISLCLADSRYTEAVVNWLISALVEVQPPLENTLVISLSAELDEILKSHGIDSVFVDPWTVLRRDTQLPTKFSHIWSTRMVLFRLLNHWGYSVVTYDSDAILMRNPHALFAELGDSDVVGSEGIYPFDLHRKWKSPTLCMGVALFRASERTELFWDLLSEVQRSLDTFDDQVLINNALQRCGIIWQPPTTDSHTVQGQCRGSGLRVTLLPHTAVCRQCEEGGGGGGGGGGYFVWHQKGARNQTNKRTVAEKGGMWFLRHDWQTLDRSELKGIEWLRFVHDV